MKSLVLLLMAALSMLAQSTTPNLTADELEKYLKEGKNVFFLDVREPKEIEELGSVEGYVNIPVSQLEARMSEVPKEKLIITLCNRGTRAAKAADMLTKAGYKTVGSCGLSDYKAKGKKLVYPKTEK